MSNRSIPRKRGVPRALSTQAAQRLTATSVALSVLFTGNAAAEDNGTGSAATSAANTSAADASAVDTSAASVAPSDQAKTLQNIEVTGTATTVDNDIPQAIDTVARKQMAQQAAKRLTDALRDVPGITLNAGEGGSHGDSLNLRGLSVPDSFFLDGIRDIGLYQRDVFNQDQVAVLLGPSSVLFGRGSTAGVINEVSKQPLQSPLAEGVFTVGTAGLARGTADFNWVLNDTTAARLNLMDEHSGVAGRDLVHNQRSGFAPSIAFGMGTDNRLTLSLLHQNENDRPDYGIPFVDGAPARVDRSNYYGLANYDRTSTNVNIFTGRFEHDFGNVATFTDTLRVAHYDFRYLATTPNLADDFTDVPPPGTPLSDILVYRDQPSSYGSQGELVNRSDLTSYFHTGSVAHTLVTGLELSREHLDTTRVQNGINDIPPTPLLNPDPFHTPPTPEIPYALPHNSGTDVSVYAVDSMALGRHWDFDAGVRWDRFNSYFSDALSGTAYTREDRVFSPRAALIFKPNDLQSWYLSYGTSYNPTVEYLTLAPSNNSLSPEKDSTIELGTKLRLLGGKLAVTGALFEAKLKNARVSDPDDPELQEMPFDQRVRGVEVGVQGYLTDHWEIFGGFSHLQDRITASTDPLALGKFAPNTPNQSVTLWTTYEPDDAWVFGGGLNYQSHRYADTENTAGVPSFTIFSAMASYKVNDHLKLQANLDNIANKLYFNNIYFSGPDESHAVPGAGRTLMLSADVRY